MVKFNFTGTVTYNQTLRVDGLENPKINKKKQLLFQIFNEQEMERILTTSNTLNLKGLYSLNKDTIF
jgi:hypothetical protein